LRAPIFAAALIAAAVPAVAQQADPTQAMIAEWQALQLSTQHTEAAIARVIASYEARLATAMVWLKAAQAEPKR
jgi:predicted component of type VI protein secretion system